LFPFGGEFSRGGAFLYFVKLRAQNLHRFITIRMLGAFDARGNDYAARFMENTYSSFHFINVLSAGSARARKGNLEISMINGFYSRSAATLQSRKLPVCAI
jgi:hypothetical protein